MTYKIEKIEGLYCVFERNGRIIAAFLTKKEAVETVNALYAGRTL